MKVAAACGVLLALASGPALAQSQSFNFAQARNPPLTVFVHVPARVTPDTPVVFALHGLLRQGAAVRDAWAPLADKHNFVVVVPQFDNAGYKGSASYNTGRVMAAGARTDPATWTFAVIEELFDHVCQRYGLTAPQYTLFGHSAGGQFVQRFVLLMPRQRMARAIAANPGWYTMPTDAAYPWGLGGTGVAPADECRAFARPLTLLLGEADNDPAHDQLNREPQAMAQGAHRFARGQHYFAAAQARAAALGCAYAWRLATVAGVGHEFDKMAAAAAALLYDKDRP